MGENRGRQCRWCYGNPPIAAARDYNLDSTVDLEKHWVPCPNCETGLIHQCRIDKTKYHTTCRCIERLATAEKVKTNQYVIEKTTEETKGYLAAGKDYQCRREIVNTGRNVNLHVPGTCTRDEKELLQQKKNTFAEDEMQLPVCMAKRLQRTKSPPCRRRSLRKKRVQHSSSSEDTYAGLANRKIISHVDGAKDEQKTESQERQGDDPKKKPNWRIVYKPISCGVQCSLEESIPEVKQLLPPVETNDRNNSACIQTNMAILQDTGTTPSVKLFEDKQTLCNKQSTKTRKNHAHKSSVNPMYIAPSFMNQTSSACDTAAVQTSSVGSVGEMRNNALISGVVGTTKGKRTTLLGCGDAAKEPNHLHQKAKYNRRRNARRRSNNDVTGGHYNRSKLYRHSKTLRGVPSPRFKKIGNSQSSFSREFNHQYLEAITNAYRYNYYKSRARCNVPKLRLDDDSSIREYESSSTCAGIQQLKKQRQAHVCTNSSKSITPNCSKKSKSKSKGTKENQKSPDMASKNNIDVNLAGKNENQSQQHVEKFPKLRRWWDSIRRFFSTADKS